MLNRPVCNPLCGLEIAEAAEGQERLRTRSCIHWVAPLRIVGRHALVREEVRAVVAPSPQLRILEPPVVGFEDRVLGRQINRVLAGEAVIQ